MILAQSITDYVTTPFRQAATLSVTAHRPWPLPGRPWVMAQTWKNLLFAHWALPYDELRRHVPSELMLDHFEGSAWLGVTPFRLTALRVRWTYPLPAASTFPELNVRTYVTRDGRPGIYFFSLDADSALAVAAARRLYRLPYFRANMAARVEPGLIRYRSRRRGEASYQFAAEYGPLSQSFQAEPGTLEHFLTERYCLYSTHGNTALRAEIHHPPWPLSPAWLDLHLNTMVPSGLVLDGDPLLHYAARQDVLVWAPEEA